MNENMWRELAYLDGWQAHHDMTRIEAFGAIRRAAEVARGYDYDAKVLRQRCHAIVDGGVSGDIGLLLRYMRDSKTDAAIVRRTIRAAIGSDKA